MRRRWPWLGLVVLAVAAGIAALVRLAPGPPPDVAATVRSADVSAADRAATTRVDTALAEVVAPWLHPLGDEVADRCFTESPATGGAVHCDRTVVRYFGFDGDRLSSLAALLNRDGWTIDVRDARPVDTVGSRRAAQWLEVAWAPRHQPLPHLTELGRVHLPHDPIPVYREARPAHVAARHQVVVAVGVTDRYFGA